MNKNQALYILRNTAWLGSDEDREATEQAVEWIQEYICNEDKWIPCSERLPEGGKQVLVTVKGKSREGITWYETSLGEYWGEDGWGNWHGAEVTAWQEVPNPWRGEWLTHTAQKSSMSQLNDDRKERVDGKG